MLGGFKIGRLAGIPFYVNPSWFLIFGFFTFTLATSQLPALAPNAAAWVYWPLAVVVGLTFFASLLAHEMGHSLVSKAFGIPVRSITLHLFGGVAQLGREVSRAREELWIALAGPAVSLVLGAIFFGASILLRDGPQLLTASLQLLALLNAGVLVFNLVPGFPLDGGRVLRAAIWGVTGNYRGATYAASMAGRLAGMLMIMGGVYLTLITSDYGNLWMALIGWFLISIAGQSYKQAVIQDKLQKTLVSEAMVRPITVPASLTVDELMAGYVRTTNWPYYYLESQDETVGIVSRRRLEWVPEHLRAITTLAGIMVPIESLPKISSSDPAVSALYKMEETKTDMLRAVEGELVVGVVPKDALFGLISRAAAAR